MRRRSTLALVLEKPRRITQTLAVDEFGELAGRKRDAARRARHLGHQLGGWRRRSNDPAGRWNAFCVDCAAVAVVCTETPDGLADSYGTALDRECQGGAA
jgi:hypothetical protein